jgi:YggT family protein
MGANTANAFLYLVTTLFNAAIWIWLLRILLQLVRADFYNPLSQLIWRVTRYPADPLRRFVPPIRRFDVASALALLLIALIGTEVRAAILGADPSLLWAMLMAVANIFIQLVHLYSISLIVQALLSWFGPGVNNPASNILWSLNEPMLRPIRRILPETPGIDLSPLVAIISLQFLAQILTPPFYR